jgi:hypothetical protein
MQKHAKTCKNMQKHAKTCKNMQKHAKTCRNGNSVWLTKLTYKLTFVKN